MYNNRRYSRNPRQAGNGNSSFQGSPSRFDHDQNRSNGDQTRSNWGKSRPGPARPKFSRSPSRSSRGPKTQQIHPSLYIKQAEMLEEQVFTPRHAFSDFMIAEPLKQNIALKGYT